METLTHDWRIEEREYDRQEQRRGRRHAYERLDPRRTALVVVDLVPFFVEEMPYARGVVPRVNTIATALRGAGGTVAWVLPGGGEPSAVSDEFFGHEIAAMYRASGGDGPLRDRLWHELAVADEDLLVEKTAPSAFFPGCLLYTSPSPRDLSTSRMPSSA